MQQQTRQQTAPKGFDRFIHFSHLHFLSWWLCLLVVRTFAYGKTAQATTTITNPSATTTSHLPPPASAPSAPAVSSTKSPAPEAPSHPQHVCAFSFLFCEFVFIFRCASRFSNQK